MAASSVCLRFIPRLRAGRVYSGARCVLQVLNHYVEGGEVEELQARNQSARPDHPSV